MNPISAYKSESIFISNSASIDAKAPAIHHQTILHAINPKTSDINKLVRENRIFDSSFLCNRAMSNKSQSKVNGMIHIYSNHSE